MLIDQLTFAAAAMAAALAAFSAAVQVSSRPELTLDRARHVAAAAEAEARRNAWLPLPSSTRRAG